MMKREPGRAAIDGIEVNYIQVGSGPDVLMLHGWGGELGSFGVMPELLATDFRVTAVSFPAHGGSTEPPVPWGIDEFEDYIVKLLDALGIERCHVIAHSFGGRVTIMMAAKHPERVGKLVLTGCAGLIKQKGAKSKLRQFAYNIFMKVASDKVKDALRDTFSSADYKALSHDMKQTFKKVINQDLREYLPQIKASALLIWGSEDTATPIEFAKIMEKEIPDAGLVVFEGCTHFAYLERMNDFVAISKHFLLNG